MSTATDPDRVREARERADRDTSYHPALASPATRGIPAGKVLVVVLVALLVAGLLNSAWMARTAQGMKPGLGRTIVSLVATPFHAVASALSLDRPRQAIDAALGRESVVGSGEIEDEQLAAAPEPPTNDGAVANPAMPKPKPTPVSRSAPATVPRPTAAKPLKILAIGDSLTTYTSQRLGDVLSQQGVAKVDKVAWRDGTGLASPSFFNWPQWAMQQIDEQHPDAVVVIMGGNDHQDMSRKDQYFARGTPEWQAEYQRRVAVVMRAMINRGVDRIYWSGPPTARNETDNALYHQINLAAAAAAKSVPGARFVDLAGPTSLKGEWLDVLVYGNDAFPARMGDGFHWSWKASQITSRLVADAMAKDYGALYPAS